MSTDAMDTKEGETITKMILDQMKIKARQVQRRSRLIKGWDRSQTMLCNHCLYLCPRLKMKIGG